MALHKDDEARGWMISSVVVVSQGRSVAKSGLLSVDFDF